jgi:hypothetical protein
LLAAGGCARTPASDPSRAFAFDVPSPVALVKGAAGGTLVRASVTFSPAYDARVRLTRGTPTAGITVLYDADGSGPGPAVDLNLAGVVLDDSADVWLRFRAAADAQDVNAYVVLTAAGVDASGRTRGLPSLPEKVLFAFP